eukprot:1536530-Pyramimonas_sp.AAC.1
MRTLPSERIGRRPIANLAAVLGSISPNTRSPLKALAIAEWSTKAAEAANAESQSRAPIPMQVPSTAAKRAGAKTSGEDFESTSVFLLVSPTTLCGLESDVPLRMDLSLGERTTARGRED